MFLSAVCISLHVEKKKTSRTVFVTYAEWNSCKEIVIANEIEIGEHSRVTDNKNFYQEETQKKLTILNTSK